MREIKFRAWSKHQGFMYYHVGSLEGQCIQPQTAVDANVDFTSIEVLHGVLMMQYTGLKDNNGQEIYEGDILRLNYGDEYRISVVRWAQSTTGGWMFMSPNGKTAFIYSNDLEVIGNIYENPELVN